MHQGICRVIMNTVLTRKNKLFQQILLLMELTYIYPHVVDRFYYFTLNKQTNTVVYVSGLGIDYQKHGYWNYLTISIPRKSKVHGDEDNQRIDRHTHNSAITLNKPVINRLTCLRSSRLGTANVCQTTCVI